MELIRFQKFGLECIYDSCMVLTVPTENFQCLFLVVSISSRTENVSYEAFPTAPPVSQLDWFHLAGCWQPASLLVGQVCAFLNCHIFRTSPLLMWSGPYPPLRLTSGSPPCSHTVSLWFPWRCQAGFRTPWLPAVLCLLLGNHPSFFPLSTQFILTLLISVVISSLLVASPNPYHQIKFEIPLLHSQSSP